MESFSPAKNTSLDAYIYGARQSLIYSFQANVPKFTLLVLCLFALLSMSFLCPRIGPVVLGITKPSIFRFSLDLRPAFKRAVAWFSLNISSNVQEGKPNVKKDALEPVAIVGLSVRFPQEATTPDGLWNLLLEKRCAATEFPKDRINSKGFFNRDKSSSCHKFSVRGGHFITGDIGEFDAPFFSITQTEAADMDPQQRILLETSYHALENAGISLQQARGSKTGVYIGSFTGDYKANYQRDTEYQGQYAATGLSANMLANRISWYFDMKGPSLNLDTACSSSLVAVHLAYQGILNHDTDAALVGGCNLIYDPDLITSLSNLNMLSPDNRCFSFDQKANGYGRGEGIGVLVLKRLSSAIRDGNTIRAVIRGTGSNQDGRTPGIFVPSAESQRQLIQSTYEKSGLGYDDTAYFEAHGTGTTAGDPIEAEGIAGAFQSRSKDCPPLYIGSVKSNIGHLEGASGVAGIVKSIIMLERGIIPPISGLESVNSKIPYQKWRIKFPQGIIRWPNEGLRRVSVSSFGFGGSNAHVILDDAANYLSQRMLHGTHQTTLVAPSNEDLAQLARSKVQSVLPQLSSRSNFHPTILLWSAMDQNGISRLSSIYGEYFCSLPEKVLSREYLGDLTFTLNHKRSLLPWRSFTLVSSPSVLSSDKISVSKPTRVVLQPSVAFVFTGQGAQWAGMGKELLIYPTFRLSLQAAEKYFIDLGCSWNLIDGLLCDESISCLHDASRSQPLCTALQIALVDLLHEFRITPKIVIGHSSGEIAAAYCAGGISREDAWKVAYYRGFLSANLAKKTAVPGSMMAVGLSPEDAQTWIDGQSADEFGHVITIGCKNSPNSTTLTGPKKAIQVLQRQLQDAGIFARKLNVDLAYHSSLMREIATEYKRLMGKLPLPEPNIYPKMVSTVTTEVIKRKELSNADYWVNNLLSPVEFSEVVKSILLTNVGKVAGDDMDVMSQYPITDIIEIGPHAVLKGPVQQICTANKIKDPPEYHSCLLRNRSALEVTLNSLGTLICRGHDVFLDKVNGFSFSLRKPRMLVDLPGYPFDHTKSFWRESPMSRNYRLRDVQRNTFLGVQVPNLNKLDARWRHLINRSDKPWLEDHVISVQYDNIPNSIDQWDESAQRSETQQTAVAGISRCTKRVSPRSYYEALERSKLGFGPSFQTIQAIDYNDKGESCCEINLTLWKEKQPERFQHDHTIHPASLDGILQSSFPSLSRGGERSIPALVPTRIGSLWLSNTGLDGQKSSTIRAFSSSEFKGLREASSDSLVLDSSNSQLIAVLREAEMTSVGDNDGYELLDSSQRKLAYFMEDKPDTELMSVSDFQRYCDSQIPHTEPPKDFYANLRKMIYLMIRKAIRDISQEDREKMSLTFQKHFHWMYTQIDLYRSKQLPFVEDGWDEADLDGLRFQELCHMVERYNSTGFFYATVGKNIQPILTGELSAPELFFKNDLVANFYREVNGHANGVQKMMEYLACLAHKYPDMKILEIGAGTGATTDQVFSTLRSSVDEESLTTKFGEYYYTDISSSFFEVARDRFQNYASRMKFKTLNIEICPISQGFEEESYDLVVAGNVLHATENLENSLINVRKILKPGGRLMLFEAVEPLAMRSGFAFGLLDGWWRGKEEFRSLGPNISAEKWDEILRETGFSGIDLEFWEYPDDICHEHSAILSVAKGYNLTPLPNPKTILVTFGTSEFQRNLTEHITNKLTEVGLNDNFIMSIEEVNDVEDLSEHFCILLLDTDTPVIPDIGEGIYIQIRNLLSVVQGFIWVTSSSESGNDSPGSSLSTGLVRSLRTENSMLRATNLALDLAASEVSRISLKICQVYQKLLSSLPDECEVEYVERSGLLFIHRLTEGASLDRQISSRVHQRLREKVAFGNAPLLTLGIKSPGLLDTLEFKEQEVSSDSLGHDEVEIETRACGVNFRDCLIAIGRIQGTKFGFECSGIVKRIGRDCKAFSPGDRVCAGAIGTFTNTVRCVESAVMHIPDSISFVQGAALPVVCCTAYYALVMVARIRKGESILIHAGAGGTGQAAIQLSKFLGAQVYTTVGSTSKKQILMQEYGIPEERIFYSRDTSFAQSLTMATGGRGVDVILNSLTGELLKSSFECLAPFGRFLEIGKKDILSRADLPMFPFSRNASFHAIDLSMIWAEKPRLMEEIRDEVVNLLARNQLTPAKPLQIYSLNEVEKAFRHLQSGKSVGKVIVEMQAEDIISATLNLRPRECLSANATYVIAGGLGGIGRSVARWMASRGAKHLVLLSRFGPRHDAAFELLQELRNNCIKVAAPACDASQESKLRSTLEEITKTMPPIKGCIISSMLLKDAIFNQMKYEDWSESLSAKYQSSWNLHKALPSKMDFFILFSSVSGVIGAAAQANYAAGNAYQDALAKYRVRLGEKAMSLDLGVMMDEGVLAENLELQRMLTSFGHFVRITRRELFALLDIYCDPDLPILPLERTQLLLGIERPATLKLQASEPASWMRRPEWSHFYQMEDASRNKGASNSAVATVNYAELLGSAESLDEAVQVVRSGLLKKVGRALAISEEDIDPNKPLQSYGVDSLVAVELRNWFSKELGADLAVFDMLGEATLTTLTQDVTERSKFTKKTLRHD